jgi:predicted ATPase
LAEAHLHTGNIEQALTILAGALEGTAKSEELWYQSELCRINGELLLKQSSTNADEAMRWFQRAIETTRAQETKTWELRATTSLARLLRDTGRRDEARVMLAEIYNWFTEGFDTADLKEAKALLDEISN